MKCTRVAYQIIGVLCLFFVQTFSSKEWILPSSAAKASTNKEWPDSAESSDVYGQRDNSAFCNGPCPACPPVRSCYTPLKYDTTYRCGSDEMCASGYKCCKDGCYVHKVCVVPVDGKGNKIPPLPIKTSEQHKENSQKYIEKPTKETEDVKPESTKFENQEVNDRDADRNERNFEKLQNVINKYPLKIKFPIGTTKQKFKSAVRKIKLKMKGQSYYNVLKDLVTEDMKTRHFSSDSNYKSSTTTVSMDQNSNVVSDTSKYGLKNDLESSPFNNIEPNLDSLKITKSENKQTQSTTESYAEIYSEEFIELKKELNDIKSNMHEELLKNTSFNNHIHIKSETDKNETNKNDFYNHAIEITTVNNHFTTVSMYETSENVQGSHDNSTSSEDYINIDDNISETGIMLHGVIQSTNDDDSFSGSGDDGEFSGSHGIDNLSDDEDYDEFSGSGDGGETEGSGDVLYTTTESNSVYKKNAELPFKVDIPLVVNNVDNDQNNYVSKENEKRPSPKSILDMLKEAPYNDYEEYED